MGNKLPAVFVNEASTIHQESMVLFVTIGTKVVSFHVTLVRLPPPPPCVYSEFDTNRDMRLRVREFVYMDKTVHK